jgi:hypothetical protein
MYVQKKLCVKRCVRSAAQNPHIGMNILQDPIVTMLAKVVVLGNATERSRLFARVMVSCPIRKQTDA